MTMSTLRHVSGMGSDARGGGPVCPGRVCLRVRVGAARARQALVAAFGVVHVGLTVLSLAAHTRARFSGSWVDSAGRSLIPRYTSRARVHLIRVCTPCNALKLLQAHHCRTRATGVRCGSITTASGWRTAARSTTTGCSCNFWRTRCYVPGTSSPCSRPRTVRCPCALRR